MTENQREAFRKNIKHLLIDKNITQRELANAANVTDQFLSMVISGVKKPPFDVVVAIANKLDVKVDDLIK
ncbi:MAG: helix-turn-helix transcriptional regulator [Clostridia bacterium]|nr:helix-turn-helix transcriptional regulator [Clostridia bacterium]